MCKAVLRPAFSIIEPIFRLEITIYSRFSIRNRKTIKKKPYLILSQSLRSNTDFRLQHTFTRHWHSIRYIRRQMRMKCPITMVKVNGVERGATYNKTLNASVHSHCACSHSFGRWSTTSPEISHTSHHITIICWCFRIFWFTFLEIAHLYPIW